MIILFINSFETTSATRQASQNPGLPTVTIDLLESSQIAHVGPKETGIVIFNGTLNVDCRPNSDIMVYVNAEDTWGSAEVSPVSLLFWESGEKPFTVECRARPRESTSSPGTVTVQGWWKIPTDEYTNSAIPYAGVKGIIEIAQFHKFTMKADQAFVELESGDEFLYNLHIQNRGNGMDTFRINVTNLDEIIDNGYKIIIEKTLVEIPENPGQVSIGLLVKTPSGEFYESYQSIKVEVISEKGLELGLAPQNFTFVIRIPGIDPREIGCSFGAFLVVFIIIFIIFVKINKYKKKKTFGELQRKNM